jgi:hypothetical protein
MLGNEIPRSNDLYIYYKIRAQMGRRIFEKVAKMTIKCSIRRVRIGLNK